MCILEHDHSIYYILVSCPQTKSSTNVNNILTYVLYNAITNKY